MTKQEPLGEYIDFYSIRSSHASNEQERESERERKTDDRWVNASISNPSKRFASRWMMWLEWKHHLCTETLLSIMWRQKNNLDIFFIFVFEKESQANPLQWFERSREKLYMRTKKRTDFCSEPARLSCWRRQQQQRRRRWQRCSFFYPRYFSAITADRREEKNTRTRLLSSFAAAK